MPHTTLKDIAKALGLSTSTVSRSLADHHAISNETKQKVKEFAEKMDYKVNPLALGLKNRRTYTVGIIVPDLAHHYFAAIISGAQDILYQKGYNLLIGQSNDNPEIETKIINHLISNHVDGIMISICKNPNNQMSYQKVIDNKIPLVFFDRICTNLLSQSGSVTLDDYSGAFNATKLMLEKGCKNPAIMSVTNSINVGSERERGFMDCLKFNGINFNPLHRFESDFTLENSKQLTYELLALKQRPDGIFITTGLSTLGCVAALKEKGFKIGDEIIVSGFLNDPYPGFYENGLIRVIPPAFKMGAESATMLLKRIDSPFSLPLSTKLDVGIQFS
jgi:LacI family transcriptional regulator